MLERLWGKGNTSASLVGMQAGTTPLDVSVAISQKIRKQLSSRPSLLGIYPKDAQLCHKDMCSTMFIAALFVTARTWKQPSSRPSNITFGYISKGCSIVLQGLVLSYVHSSIVCHYQNLETT